MLIKPRPRERSHQRERSPFSNLRAFPPAAHPARPQPDTSSCTSYPANSPDTSEDQPSAKFSFRGEKRDNSYGALYVSGSRIFRIFTRARLSPLCPPTIVPFEILIAFSLVGERAERPFARRIDIAVCRLKLGSHDFG